MNIARSIRLTRLARGVSQQDLASATGISQSYLSLLESGRKEPSLAMIRTLAEGLDISEDLIFLSAIEYSELHEDSADVLSLLAEQLLTLISPPPPRRQKRK